MKPVQTNAAPATIGPYSQGIAEGGLLFTSGQLPVLPATGNIEATGTADQTRQSLENLKAILEAEGRTLADVVKTTVFLADIGDFAEMNAVYAEYFAAPYPARSCFQVAALPMGARVEIEAICGL